MYAGLSTLEMEAADNLGEDWEEMLDQCARELAAFKERGLPPPSWARRSINLRKVPLRSLRPNEFTRFSPAII
ncbi:hypothetical protein ARSQ2_00061 [Arsenophonus endosymbiont of Bemisia tabaci Q2]|nr:hypothetical protein ARSQ2_00061 [Arsenophonus endosymbiont of Bemisia tabaci Q2]